MKILLVHNDYGAYSGEEKAVDMMALMLENMGLSALQLRTSTSGVRNTVSGRIRVFLNSIYSFSGRRLMRKSLKIINPSVVIINNLYPFISPWSLLECHKAGIPVVMRVHNYRLLCPNGLFYSNGNICECCLTQGYEWPCIIRNCTGELLKSVIYALRNALARYRKLYINNVNKYVCLTDFQKYKLIEGGISEERIEVIANHVCDFPKGNVQIGNYVGVCGRLSEEKGIDLILQAAVLCPDIHFKIAGETYNFYFSNVPANVEFCGFLKGDSLEEFFLEARFMVSGSRCYEGQPMSVIEAALHSKISIIPLHGSFLEILSSSDIQRIAGYRSGDLYSLVNRIRYLWNNPEKCIKLGNSVRNVAEKEYSLSGVSKKWKRVLDEVVNIDHNYCQNT